jgi:deazaflavin-dependent oxidoreductase (nitroreductase family)
MPHRPRPRASRGSEAADRLTTEIGIQTERDAMEDELVASGRFVRIETRGSTTGLTRLVTVGFVEAEDASGSLFVAATAPDAAWARNLLDDPRCHVRVGEASFDAVAERLGGTDHARVVREMILRYGTPSEGLGRGPSFRLVPVDAER